MRVRIKQNPIYPDSWRIETKNWWSTWTMVEFFSGNDSQQRALETAKRLMNPNIIEVLE